MTSRDNFRNSRKGGTGGGGWVHPKGADSMAVSGLHFENALVGSEWTTAVLLCTNGLHPKGADSTAVSELRSENALVGYEWATLSSYSQTGSENGPLVLHGTHF